METHLHSLRRRIHATVMWSRRAAIVALAAVAALLAITTSNTAPAAAESQAVVVVTDYAFAPASLVVSAGTLVVFSNQGAATHRIVADDDAFSSPGLQPDQEFSYRFASPGTFRYHCTIHTRMTGTIVVTQAAQAPATPASPTTAVSPTRDPTNLDAADSDPATAQDPTTLAMTGSLSMTLAAAAGACLLLGACALALGRKSQVVVPALAGWRTNDDLLPAGERARR